MKAIRESWRTTVFEAVKNAASKKEIEVQGIEREQVIIERPPNPDFGDLAFPMFPFSRYFKTAPAAVALLVKDSLDGMGISGAAHVDGPYININLPRRETVDKILTRVFSENERYGSNAHLAGRRVMIEFSCPNTNKPLHLGHLRNNAIGISLSNILEENGAELLKVNLINDRGIHICKSMIAYKKFGEGKTPESEGIKGDHFVGEYYVRYSAWEKEESEAEELARDLLRKWEAGDPETYDLWKTMNGWTISGIEQTYGRTGISFDRRHDQADLTRPLAEVEAEYIRNVLASVEGNKTEAAKILEIDRKTLRKKLDKTAD